MLNWNEFDDRDALIDGVSRRLHERLGAALKARREAWIALAGGSTPMPIYARLAGMELDWTRVTAVATDERWVPADHEASNGHQIRRRFAGTGLRVASLVPDDARGAANVDHADQTLAALTGPFDVVVLGMGNDAHFASLFPHSPALPAGLDPHASDNALVVVPDPLPPEAPFARVSLTLAKLLATRSLMLVIAGQAKREALERAARAEADPHRLPAAALLRAAGKKLEIFWSP